MSKKIIHVNRQYIGFNTKVGRVVLPTYIVREGSKKSVYGYGVKINGPSVLVDTRSREKDILSCGARAWIETDSEVEVIEPMDYQDAQKIKKSVKIQYQI